MTTDHEPTTTTSTTKNPTTMKIESDIHDDIDKEIHDTFKESSTSRTPANIDDMIASACPIWTVLNITEEEYYKKYHSSQMKEREDTC